MKKNFIPGFGLALVLAGCSSADETPQAQNEVQSTVGEPIVEVDGQSVTREELEFHMQRRTQGQSENDRQALLGELIELTLLARQAEQQALHEEAEVAAAIENLRKRILAQAIVEQVRQREVSAEDLQAAYDKRYAGERPQEYRASHILVDDQGTAQQLLVQLQQGGDFTELARQHSAGPTGENGGDLGWFQPEQMVQPFAEAVQKLEPGKVTPEPVQTQFGWHVIRLEDVRAVEPPELSKVENELRQELVQSRIQGYIGDLRSNAQIEFKDAQ